YGVSRAVAVVGEGGAGPRTPPGTAPGPVERFPPAVYLRETPLTSPDAKITDFAGACRDDAGGKVLGLLHLVLERLHRDMTYDTDPTHAATTAAQAFALGRGVCQDLTHVFVAAARSLAI